MTRRCVVSQTRDGGAGSRDGGAGSDPFSGVKFACDAGLRAVENNGLAGSSVSARKVINGETRASPAGHLLFNCRNLIRRPNTVRSTKPNHARRANAAGETCQTPDTRSDPEALLGAELAKLAGVVKVILQLRRAC